MLTMLQLQPIDFDEACRFIAEHHRHHLPPVGWKFGIAVNDGERVVGVVTVDRPSQRRRLTPGGALVLVRNCPYKPLDNPVQIAYIVRTETND
jgi:hypothetical protein